MTRALITGCSGCIGSNLTAALNRRGIDVIGLVQPQAPTRTLQGLHLTRVTGDILDRDSLLPLMRSVDWVFHLAAVADDWKHTPETIQRVNVQGSVNVFSAALEAGVKRLVYTSSAAALGSMRPGVTLLDETSPFNLPPDLWPYAHSKITAEQILQDYIRRGLDAVSVLPSAVLGPGDQSLISGQLVLRALQGEWFPFPSGGANFIDARDAAAGHLAAAEHGRTGERYLLAGHNLSHLSVLGTLSDVLQLPVRYLPLPNAVLPGMARAVGLLRRGGVRLPIDEARIRLSGQYLYYDNRKAVRELGLAPRPFAESVQAAFQWYLAHGYLDRCRLPGAAVLAGGAL